MYKKTLPIICTLLSTAAVAQTTSFQSTTPAANQQSTLSTLPPQSKNVLSPSDFSSATTKASAQSQAQFKQQLDQKLSQVPPPKIISPPNSAFGNLKPPTTPSNTTEQKTSTPSSETNPDETTNETETPTAPAPSVSTPAPAPAPATTNTAPSTTTTPNAPKAQPYTGFGTQSGGQGNSNTSGGWNVKY